MKHSLQDYIDGLVRWALLTGFVFGLACGAVGMGALFAYFF